MLIINHSAKKRNCRQALYIVLCASFCCIRVLRILIRLHKRKQRIYIYFLILSLPIFLRKTRILCIRELDADFKYRIPVFNECKSCIETAVRQRGCDNARGILPTELIFVAADKSLNRLTQGFRKVFAEKDS